MSFDSSFTILYFSFSVLQGGPEDEALAATIQDTTTICENRLIVLQHLSFHPAEG